MIKLENKNKLNWTMIRNNINQNLNCVMGDLTPLNAIKKFLYLYKENDYGDMKLSEFVDLMGKYLKQTDHIYDEINKIFDSCITSPFSWITSFYSSPVSFAFSSAPVPPSLSSVSLLPYLYSKVPLSTLSPLPPTANLSLKGHFNLMPHLLNVHSLEFKIITGILIIAILALILSVIILIFEILKSFYIKVCAGEHSDQWNKYISDSPIQPWYRPYVLEGRAPWCTHVPLYVRRRRGRREDDDGSGNYNPGFENAEEFNLRNMAINLLNRVRIFYTHHSYLHHEAYNPDGSEINPRAMEEYRRSGNFERYGILDRARYLNVADCPYEVTDMNDWYELYQRILIFIWNIDKDYLADPLPTHLPVDGLARNNYMYITYIEAARNLGIPRLHVAQRTNNSSNSNNNRDSENENTNNDDQNNDNNS